MYTSALAYCVCHQWYEQDPEVPVTEWHESLGCWIPILGVSNTSTGKKNHPAAHVAGGLVDPHR